MPNVSTIHQLDRLAAFASKVLSNEVQLSSFGEVTLMREITETLEEAVDPVTHPDAATRLCEAVGQVWGLSTLIVSRPFSMEEDTARARRIAALAARIALEAFPENEKSWGGARDVLVELSDTLDSMTEDDE